MKTGIIASETNSEDFSTLPTENWEFESFTNLPEMVQAFKEKRLRQMVIQIETGANGMDEKKADFLRDEVNILGEPEEWFITKKRFWQVPLNKTIDFVAGVSTDLLENKEFKEKMFPEAVPVYFQDEKTMAAYKKEQKIPGTIVQLLIRKPKRTKNKKIIPIKVTSRILVFKTSSERSDLPF